MELSCYASKEEISRAIKPLVEKHFPVDAETLDKEIHIRRLLRRFSFSVNLFHMSKGSSSMESNQMCNRPKSPPNNETVRKLRSLFSGSVEVGGRLYHYQCKNLMTCKTHENCVKQCQGIGFTGKAAFCENNLCKCCPDQSS